MRRVDSWQPKILIAKLSAGVRRCVCAGEICLRWMANYSK